MKGIFQGEENDERVSDNLFIEELLIFFMGIKCGYSSPQTLTDQSTAIKRGEKGDLQVLRPHLMCCVPVSSSLSTLSSSSSSPCSSLVRSDYSGSYSQDSE